jgi:DnaJ-class molecular chaperone
MFDKFVADSIICDQCQGSGRVGQQECTCRGGEVIAQAVRRLRWDDATGCLLPLPDAISPGKEQCPECGGWGLTHSGTVQDDEDVDEEPCPCCDGSGEVDA